MLKENTIAFVSMVGQNDPSVKRMRYPTVPVFVEHLVTHNDGTVDAFVRWFYGTPTSFTKAGDAKQNVAFSKFWDKDIIKKQQAQKKKSKAITPLTKTEIEHHWLGDTIDGDTFVRVHVPESECCTANIWDGSSKGDTISVSGQFLKDTLIPQCIKQGVVRDS